MVFIVDMLIVWFVVMVLAGVVATLSQIRTMKNFMKADINVALEPGKMFDGVSLTFIAAFIATLSGLLFFVAVVGSLAG